MDSLLDTIKEFIRHSQKRNYWLAYSGGLDSHVLLHLFVTARRDFSFSLKAVHVNHGISSHAEKWAEHCKKICEAFHVDFIQHTLCFPADPTSSPEEILRHYRYEFFSQLLTPDDILLTAHHQDDQAETVLLQLLRGAGPKGLAAMPSIKLFGRGQHARPLLHSSRSDLLHYAKSQALSWIEDESNTKTQYDRNFIRHQVLPLLNQRWPSASKTLSRAAEQCASAQTFVEATANHLLKDMQGKLPETLSLKKMLQHDENQQVHLLRAWILKANFPLPSVAKMQQILKTIFLARDDKIPYVKWGKVEIRRYRDDLFLQHSLPQHDVNQEWQWDFSKPLLIPLGKLQATLMKGKGLKKEISSVTVKFRKGGEVIQLPHRKHHHDLKKLFQAFDIPPWLRNRIPLLYVDDTLICVVGWCIAEGWGSEEATGWIVDFMPY